MTELDTRLLRKQRPVILCPECGQVATPIGTIYGCAKCVIFFDKQGIKLGETKC